MGWQWRTESVHIRLILPFVRLTDGGMSASFVLTWACSYEPLSVEDTENTYAGRKGLCSLQGTQPTE